MLPLTERQFIKADVAAWKIVRGQFRNQTAYFCVEAKRRMSFSGLKPSLFDPVVIDLK
jgi:hypothetical protein